MAWYAYCLTEQQNHNGARSRRPFILDGLNGVDGAPVLSYPSGEFAVVVSEYAHDGELEKKAILEHARVVSACFRTMTVLPFRFGTIFETDEALRQAVRSNRRTFGETVQRLRGKAEMHLKVVIHDGSLREVMTDIELPATVGGEYLSKLRVQAARERERQTKARALSVQVHRLFNPLDEEITCKKVDADGMLIDIAHLIEHKSVDKYQNRYSMAAKQLKNCEILISGPWPPYHFLPGKLRTVAGNSWTPAARAASNCAAQVRRPSLAMVATTAKILIVDDEPGVLLTTRAILQQEGYDVEAAASGQDAVEAIRQRHYDLVLTDLKMPGVGGLDVLAEVRKRSPLTVTVMMTGYGSVFSALDAVRLGAYEYLLKPIEVEDLKQAVRRSLERKRLSEIDTLYRISWTVTQSQDPATMASEISDAVRGVLGVDYACLLTPGEGGWKGNGSPALGHALDSPSLRRALQRGLIVTDQEHDEAAAAWAQDHQVRSFALVPGIAANRLVCVLCAHNGREPYDFHASAVRFLQGLASQTALALENTALIRELKSNNEELAAANRKLQELDKLKSNFLSVATHELRTPLSVILGYNAMLEEGLQDRLDESERQTLTESIAACKRLIRMVNSMLDISQIESGKMKMEFVPSDLRRLVNGVAALFHQEARSRRLHLRVELPARSPRIELDAERIEQVLINLVGNALKFTPAGGSIVIRLRIHPELRQVEISVQDTGVGIPPEDQTRIFDEFTQVRHAHAGSARDGSGLGLAIAKRIVEAHHGQLRVSSTPGQGSTFSFTLPLKADHSDDYPVLDKAVPA